MRRKITWIIPSVLVLALLGLLAILPASAAPSGAVGSIAMTGGESSLGLFYSDKEGFNTATITVTDADLSSTRTGTARIITSADNAGSSTPFLLTGATQTGQAAAILAGESAQSDKFDSVGNSAVQTLTLTKKGRDANDDGALTVADVTLKVGGITKTPAAIVTTVGGIDSVTLAAADNTAAGDDNVTVDYEYSEYDQTVPTGTPLSSATVQFAADFAAATVKNNQTTDVISNTANSIKTTSNIDGTVAASDSITISFTYDVAETITKLVTVATPSLSARGLTRSLSGVETTASSSSFVTTVALFSGSDFDKISVAAADAGVTTVDGIEAFTSVGATLGARVGVAAVALGIDATAQAVAGSDDTLVGLLIPVADGEVVTTSYDDGGTTRSDIADMDMKAPTVEIVSPVSGTNTNNLAQTLVVKITDDNSAGGKASGLTVGNADTMIVETRGNGTIHDASNDENLVPLLVATNSFQISRSLTFTSADEGTIRFWVPAVDDVGNTASFSDSRTAPETAQGVANPAVLGAGDPTAATLTGRPGNPGTLVLDVSAPAPITNAVKTGGIVDTRLTVVPTGSHTGSDGAAAMTDSTAALVAASVEIGDKITNLTDGSSCTLTAIAATVATCTLASGVDNDWDLGDNYKVTNSGLGDVENLNTATSSVQIEFSLGTGTSEIDGDTVDAADFTVAGSTVSSAVVDGSGNKILLGLAAALATDAKPNWELTGVVKDKAGNEMATVTGTSAVAALDGLAPVISTPTIVGTAGTASNGDITIDFTSGEAASSTPVVTATYLEVASDTTLQESSSSKSLSVSTNGVNAWQAVVDIDDITGSSRAGLVNLRVSLADASGNTASAGKADPDGTTAANAGTLVTGALVFEFDNRLNEGVSSAIKVFTVSPDTKATTDAFESDSASPFITMDFDGHTPTNNLDNSATGGEDKEYTIGTVEPDTHKTVTLTSATWTDPDGVATDVLALVNTADVNSFVYAPTGLAVGTHSLAVQAKDEVGNVSTSIGSTTATTFTLSLKVVERSAYKVPVKPGFNLVSIPAASSVTAINDVIAADSGIDFVMTYDNSTGLWLVANRDADTGLLEGNLTTLDAAHAYWVESDRFLNLEFTIPRSTAGHATFPTVISVYDGWNVVPVGNPAQGAAGTAILADTYFSGLTWSAAYTYDTAANSYVKIVAGDNVVIGQGYYLYVTKDGVIIP